MGGAQTSRECRERLVLPVEGIQTALGAYVQIAVPVFKDAEYVVVAYG